MTGFIARTVPITLMLSVLALGGDALADGRPNILVFVADDAGWNDFGAYGHPTIDTPTIDALARNGWTADSAFLTTPQCSPSRISMLSGLYAHQTGAEDLHVPLPPGQRLVPDYLREAGYFTGLMLKSHLGPEGDRQFDWRRDEADFGGFLDAAADQPFFLWVGFRDPHRAYGDAPKHHSAADVRLPPTVVDTPETRADYVAYYDEIHRMDGSIAAFIRELEERDLYDDTILLFLSDNGSPMPRAKGTLYDAGIRTPLIVAGSGIPAGVRYGGLISVIDLAPTILDWGGADVPDSMVGASLARGIADGTLPGRDYVFSERNWHNADEHMRSIRGPRYKLIWNNYVHLPHGTAADITSSPTWQALRLARERDELSEAQALLFAAPRPRVELYDLSNDPDELDNLAGEPEHRGRVQALMARLEQWMAATGDVPPERRRRDDNVDRLTGVKFTSRNPPLIDGQPTP